MDIQQNLQLFRELMLCDGNIYSWCYDCEGRLLGSNCPDEAVLAVAFQAFGCLDKMLSRAAQGDVPTFLSSDTGLVWGAAFEKEAGALLRCHVIGPVFYASVSANQIFRNLMNKDFSSYSAAWVQSLRYALERVPTSQYTIFSRNLRMLHYCVTGQHIGISDVYVDDIQMLPTEKGQLPKDRHRVYTAEQAMLHMVQLGDLNYREALNASMMISNGVSVRSGDPMKSALISTVVFCSIVSRAAIQGGLSPEEGYRVGDAYIQSAVDAATLDELTTICMNMYDDFIHRVHALRENPAYSPVIRRCCDYIDMNLSQNIQAKDLAQLVGYTPAYLARRFREETGFGISDYLRAVRVERAKMLLDTTQSSVAEIAIQLGFSTRNYFTACFREVTGMTPSEYRAR